MFTTDSKARAAIEDLEEQFTKLKREFSALQMDWADTLDKVKRMMQRIAKRAEVAEKLEAEQGEQGGEELGPVAVPMGPDTRRQIIADAYRRLRGISTRRS